MPGQTTGDSGQPLTLSSAAELLAGTISDEDIGEPAAEPKTAPRKPAPAPAPAPEPEPEEEPEANAEVEPEAEPDPDEESEPAEEPDDTPRPRTLKVKVDGQEIEVPEDEVVAGYSRQQDYTRKTQKLSEERRAFETEQMQTRAARQEYHQALTEIQSYLAGQWQEPDWDKLRVEDPAGFAQVHAAWQVHKDRLNAVAAERQRIEQQFAADAEREYEQHLKAEAAKLLDVVPEWKNAETAKKERASLFEYGKSVGYTDDDLNGISDHRAINILRKAMLYDQLQREKAEAAKKAQPKMDKVKSATPGSSAGSKPKVSEVTRARQRLAKTHRVADAAAVLALTLPDD